MRNHSQAPRIRIDRTFVMQASRVVYIARFGMFVLVCFPIPPPSVRLTAREPLVKRGSWRTCMIDHP